MTKCEYCNSKFTTSENVTNKRFCSPLCRRRARSDRDRGISINPVKDRTCITCGTFISSNERKDKIYCSNKCKCKYKVYPAKNKFSNEKEAITNYVDKTKHLISQEEGTDNIEFSKGTILLDRRVIPCFSSYSIYIKDGYAFISPGGRPLPIHRIVYLLQKGILSTKEQPIDHINQNKLDNRIDNLRLTTPNKNMANRKLKPNKSGYRGVYPHFDKWIAQICIKGKVKALGRFITKEEAALAYNQAALELWGDDAEVNELVNQ
jgi:hypothetical protein